MKAVVEKVLAVAVVVVIVVGPKITIAKEKRLSQRVAARWNTNNSL